MSGIGDRLPVERLSERSRGRIERAVFDALAQEPAAQEPRRVVLSRTRSGLLAFGGLAVVATLATIMLWPRAATSPRPAAPLRLVARDAPLSQAIEGAELELSAGSALVVTSDASGGQLVVLERGTVGFHVAKRGARPPFVVQAGDVRVEVVGTRFEVAREQDGARVTVDEGTVRVVSATGSTLVHAGERWPAARASADVEPPSAPEPAVSPPSPAEAPAPRTPHAKTPAAPRVADRAVTGAPTDVADARALFERAASMETSDPVAALGLYERVAAGAGPWAAYALFASARLELDRGHTADGRRLLGDYLRRFPDGPNADDARLLLK